MGRGFENGPARVYHDIPLRGDLAEAHAEQFAQPAFGAIAAHGIPKGARNGETDARSVTLFPLD